MTIQTRSIAFDADGTRCEGLLAWDDGISDPRPGILICPTIRGRSKFEDSKAVAIAELGYAGLALDLYGLDTRDTDIDTFRTLMNGWKADRPGLQQRLLAWVAVLQAQNEVDAAAVAAIGYCFGGLCVLDIARMAEDVAGVASFHGLFDAPGNTFDNAISAKVLVMHGWDDPLATPDAVEGLAVELTRQGADRQIHAYGNTLHAFTNPAANDNKAGTVYNMNADRRSWQALQNFLEELF